MCSGLAIRHEVFRSVLIPTRLRLSLCITANLFYFLVISKVSHSSSPSISVTLAVRLKSAGGKNVQPFFELFLVCARLSCSVGPKRALAYSSLGPTMEQYGDSFTFLRQFQRLRLINPWVLLAFVEIEAICWNHFNFTSLHFRMQSIGQVIYIRQQHSRGPKTVPCENPELTGEALDAQLAHKLLDQGHRLSAGNGTYSKS